MEQTITGIEILPRDQAVVTPRELLEDFADHTARWGYLERETEHYTTERDQPSILLRHRQRQDPLELNFIFVSRDGLHGAFHLRLIAPHNGDPSSLTARHHQEAMEQFTTDFQSYLDRCNKPLRLKVTHLDEQPPIPAS